MEPRERDPPGSFGAAAGAGWPAIAVLCLGVWLHAADSLLAAAISALAPDMAAMLLGRLLQGWGGGWMVALSHVGVTQLFPPERWPQLLAVISGVWGVSALLGPLIGGAFATAGLWRGGFWAFALQALALAALMPLLLGPRTRAARAPDAVPWRRVLVLSAGVLAVLAAGVQPSAAAAALLAALGLALLAAALLLERRRNQLFPPRPLDLRQPWGPGYVMILSLSLATVSLTVYGPLLMALLHGATPLTAGLMIALESVSWTIAAIVFAGAAARHEPLLISGGALTVTAGIAGLAWTMPEGPVAALAPSAVLLGAGFGMAWAFVMRRVVESVPAGERERAASSLPTIQLLGYALGAAACGIVANLAGLAADAPRPVLESAAFWLFAAFLPLALVGSGAAWRLSRAAG